MPRRKVLTDATVLDAALRLIHESGPDALTFARMSEITGLSASTLVQRFGTKAALLQSALLRAWDQLDRRTAELAASLPKTPEGGIALLVGLSEGYGGIENYAQGLRVLREDFLDPVLRARGTEWRGALCTALDACLAGLPGHAGERGLMMAAQWQGSLLWWGFDPRSSVEAYVEESLRRFVAEILRAG